MAALVTLLRLGLGGLFLDQRAFQVQRDAPGGVARGAALVALVALLVTVAALLGNLGESLTQPDPRLVSATISQSLRAMPWYAEATASSPTFATDFAQIFTRLNSFSLTPNLQTSLLGVVTAPFLALLGWLLTGTVVHGLARAFGGSARFGQTLACTAVASGASLLGLVQVVPYAEMIPGALFLASALLGLLGTYVAVREAHGLPPWRSFWAVTLGPLLLTLLLLVLYCCFAFMVVSALRSVGGGSGR